jgi:hypothetical protein
MERTAKLVSATVLLDRGVVGTEAVLHGAGGFAQRFLDQYITQGRNFGRSFGERRNPQHVAQHDPYVLASLESSSSKEGSRSKDRE